MALQALPAYFIVRINIEEQKKRKEKQGSILLHHAHVYMTRNMQCGEIVSIGAKALDKIPQAERGDTAIFHHFVEKEEVGYFLMSDETYNYYAVTAYEYNGKGNQTYGICKKDGTIIPSLDYVFLEVPSKKEYASENEFIDKNVTTTAGGLLVFNNWTETRTDSENKMKKIQAEIDNLAQTTMNDQVKKGIEAKEAELAKLSNKINSKRYENYTIAYINPILSEELEEIFNQLLQSGDEIYALNIAAQTRVEFNNIEYIMMESKYIGVPQKWAQEAVH